jgi:hypothetical protein
MWMYNVRVLFRIPLRTGPGSLQQSLSQRIILNAEFHVKRSRPHIPGVGSKEGNKKSLLFVVNRRDSGEWT